jgi:hypothetical protein
VAAAPGFSFPGNTPNAISLAWAANTPQVVGRVKEEGHHELRPHRRRKPDAPARHPHVVSGGYFF